MCGFGSVLDGGARLHHHGTTSGGILVGTTYYMPYAVACRSVNASGVDPDLQQWCRWRAHQRPASHTGSLAKHGQIALQWRLPGLAGGSLPTLEGRYKRLRVSITGPPRLSRTAYEKMVPVLRHAQHSTTLQATPPWPCRAYTRPPMPRASVAQSRLQHMRVFKQEHGNCRDDAGYIHSLLFRKVNITVVICSPHRQDWTYPPGIHS